MRYHLMPVRIAVIKYQVATDAGEDVDKQECVYTDGGSVD